MVSSNGRTSDLESDNGGSRPPTTSICGGGVMGNTPDSGSGDCWFKSNPSPHLKRVGMVELADIEDLKFSGVNRGGSNPPSDTITMNITEVLGSVVSLTDCKSVAHGLVGSIPTSSTNKFEKNLGVTQSGVENLAWNQEVEGSNPSTQTKYCGEV